MDIAKKEPRSRQSKRDVILNAARAVFFDKGYEKATVDDIAEKAQIAKGTVYLYFASKDEICLALSIEAFDTFLDLFEKEIASEKTALEKILTLGEMFYELHTKHPAQFKILQDCEMLLTDNDMSRKSDIERRLLNHKHKIKELLEQLVREGQKEKSIRADMHPGKTAIIIIKITRLYILTTTKLEKNAMAEEETNKEEMIKQLFFFIRSALEPRF